MLTKLLGLNPRGGHGERMKNKGASNSPDRVEASGSPESPPALQEDHSTGVEEMSAEVVCSEERQPERFKETILPSLKGTNDKGKIWDVTIIEVGQSLNGPIYTEEALREAAPVFEGVPVYTYKWGENLGHLSDEARAQDSRGFVGNLVGSLEGVYFNEESKSLDGRLKVYCEDTRSKLAEAWEMGDIGNGSKEDILGLSIDAQGLRGEDGLTVTKFTEASSVDIVTAPAAGGRIKRLVAALRFNEFSQENEMPSHYDDESKLEEDIADHLMKVADALGKSEDPKEQHAMLKELLTVLSSMLEKESGEGEKPEEGEMEESARMELTEELKAEFDKISEENKSLKESIVKLLETEAVKSNPEVVEAVSKIVPQEQSLTEEQKVIESLQARLREQAISSELSKHASDLRLHNPDLALKLIDMDSVKVCKDYREVSGLKEALVALIKAEPYLAQEAVEEKSETETVNTETVNVEHSVESKKAPIGQGAESVALRESVQQSGVSMSSDQISRRLAHLRSKALQGDCRAAVEHRRLRSQLSQ